MENLTKVANAIFTSKPELELLKIWGEMMNRNNVAMNSEASELCQTLVVDAYYGIQQKLGRTKIDGELLSSAFDEIKELLSFGEIGENSQVNEAISNLMEGLATGKVKLEGMEGVDLAAMFGGLTPPQETDEPKPNTSLKEDPTDETIAPVIESVAAKQEIATEQVLEPVLSETQEGVEMMGKVVEMPKIKAEKVTAQ